LNRISWGAHNDGEDLIPIIEKFKEKYGHYPAKICADEIYRTKANIAFCEERDIEING